MAVSTRSKRKALSPLSSSLSSKQGKITNSSTSAAPLLVLSPHCVSASLVCRPSKHNKSPYVADIYVPSLQREAICHVPNLDMGGKCIPGVQLWVEPLKDKEGNLVGPHAISTKYGTPKCEFSSRLVRVDETNLHPSYTPTWVGGHPSLGEQIAKALIDRHASTPIPDWPRAISSVQSQVRLDSRSRVDFVVHHPQSKPRLVEVKTVVDTDYCVSWPLPQRAKCVFTSSFHPYRRCALFPWGSSNQKGPDGQAVVSARAIKHVHELTKLHERLEYDATILFIVIRGDAQVFAPNAQACPTFARYLQQAQEAGVQILAKRVQWDHLGQCWDDEWLPVEFPQDLETQE